MPSIQFIVTDAGRAALVNAQHNGTNAVTIAEMGVSGTPIVATPATGALPGEVKRIATISGGAVAADTMHVVVRDESADVFTVRSFALYLSDGTLFASYGQAGVIAEKSAQAMLLFAVDVIFADINAAMLTFGDANFVNPPATTDTAGVLKLATDAEAVAMANAIKALTPRGMALAFTAANILSRLLTADGAGSGLDADLLDGQQGSYYTDIAGRLGYTPLNRAGDAMTGPLGIQASTGADAPLRVRNVTGSSSIDIIGDGGAVYGQVGLASPSGPTNFRLVSSNLLELYAQNGIRASIHSGAAAFYVPITRSGATVWDAANDGAGSGLDADLLDGQDGGYYSNIVARLGFTPANLAGDIFSGSVGIATAPAYRLDVLGGVGQGARIGKARLLDDGPFVTGANLEATAGALALGTATAQPISFHIGGSLAGAFGANGLLNVLAGITRAGNTVWDAANDGSGSGLDADLLDGLQASAFALLAGATFTGNVGVRAAATGFALTLGTPAGSQGSALFIKPTGTSIATPAYDLLEGTVEIVGGPSSSAGNGFHGTSSVHDFLLIRGGSERLRLTNSGVSVTGTVTVTGGITRGGSTVWDAANDGAGSGLDADMVDGKQASEFALLSGATFAGAVIVPTLLTVAGTAGSPNYVLLNNTANAGGKAWRVGDTGAAAFGAFSIYNVTDGVTPVIITPAGAVTLSGSLSVTGTITRSGNTIWDAANDGSGSGLDADLLDGMHASAFALLTDATRAGSNAYGSWEMRPNGVIEQWGTVNANYSEGQIAITFPIAFTDANSIVVTPVAVNAVASDKFDISIQRVSTSVNGCVVFAQYSAAASSVNQINGIDWRAIGR